ncbi:uncharacterized protein KY384_008226 [Bacidia gigantensis]|uniref:uncharacterized protein n=1 Tax=Bacidia gigantensis TaxID=2732470 RepID=UPI001D05B538|nr:uncharacterized protein KY384_008226 [Bacidia gigantensis]KAG8526797.1 hypothetical protein KY384_008226 [Bacidia gigantensis]
MCMNDISRLALTNLRDYQDSSWLNIDHLPGSGLKFKDGITKDNFGSDSVKDGRAEDDSHEIKQYFGVAEDGPRDGDEVGHGMEDAIADSETDGIDIDAEVSYGKEVHRAGLGGDAETDAAFPEEQNPSDTQALQAPVHSPRVARRCRGRPCRSRPAIALGNTTWEVIKIVGDQQSGERRVLKVQVEAWLAEEGLSTLHDAIAIHRGKQGRTRGKRKTIYGTQRRSGRRGKKKPQATGVDNLPEPWIS